MMARLSCDPGWEQTFRRAGGWAPVLGGPADTLD